MIGVIIEVSEAIATKNKREAIMTAHSPVTRLMFGQKKRKLKLEDMPATQQTELKENNRSKGHSQDADRHAKTFHQKSNEK